MMTSQNKNLLHVLAKNFFLSDVSKLFDLFIKCFFHSFDQIEQKDLKDSYQREDFKGGRCIGRDELRK